MSPVLRRGRIAAVVALLLFCFPGGGLAQGASSTAAPAPESSPEFQRYLLSASRLYEDLEYERALNQLASAKRFARTVEDDVRIALYEGIILADLGKKEESIAAFKAALFLKPDAKLPVKVSPKVERDFEAVRASVRKELAPIIARQEAEKQRLAEERRAAELKAQEEEKQRLEEERRTAELKAQEEEKQRQEEERRVAELKVQQEAEKRREEERRAAELKAQEEAERQRATANRPVLEPTTPIVSAGPDLRTPPVLEAPRRSTPVLPFVLLGAGAVAGGVGGYLGMQSKSDIQSARDAGFQSVRVDHLENARGKALVANILIGTATAAGIGALIGFLSSGGDETPVAEASR